MCGINVPLLLVLLVVSFGISIVGKRIIPRKCTASEDCVRISICNTINYDFTSLLESDRNHYTRTRWCNGTLSDPDLMVCCSDYVPESVLPDQQNYAEVSDVPKVFGAEDAKIHEFPWLALLEYRNPNSSTPDYHCAGSLISHRYVLTAAHCINDNLIHVHLGKYYSDRHENCDASEFCAHPTVTVDIEKAIKHEVPELNDIALIRLSKVVHYTDFIKPISLPSVLGSVSSSTNTNLIIVGWGKGALTSAKQKLAIPIINLEMCKEQYEQYANEKINVTENHVCAGGETHAGACVGDSGGSLSATVDHEGTDKYVIEGILSSGYDFCGDRNKYRYPMLFTKVAAFERWITGNMRPENVTTN